VSHLIKVNSLRILVGIMTCWPCELNGDNQSLRDTWLRDLTVDYKFFHGWGLGEFSGSDSVLLEVPDSYSGLILKSQALHSWGYKHGYDFVFQAYPDTYVDVSKLMASGFEKHDYAGYIHTKPQEHPNTPYGLLGGGEGYWTSRRACDIIRKAAPSVSADLNFGAAEDLWTANVLGEAGIPMVGLPGYGRGVTLHGSMVTDAPRGTYDHRWMYEMYCKGKNDENSN